MSADNTETHIAIYYCTKCRWLLRAAWIAQELLTTFDEELYEVSLRPGDKGQFDIYANDNIISCRKEDGGFPDLKTLKKIIRDRIDPEMSLGHTDR